MAEFTNKYTEAVARLFERVDWKNREQAMQVMDALKEGLIGIRRSKGERAVKALMSNEPEMTLAIAQEDDGLETLAEAIVHNPTFLRRR